MIKYLVKGAVYDTERVVATGLTRLATFLYASDKTVSEN